MKLNIKKLVTSTFIIASLSYSGYAYAGSYDQDGLIISVRAQSDGWCYGWLKYHDTNDTMKFWWDCTSGGGKAMLSTVYFAQMNRSDVIINLEPGDAEVGKKLNSIHILPPQS